MSVIRITRFTFSCNMQIFCSSLFEYVVLIWPKEKRLLATSTTENKKWLHNFYLWHIWRLKIKTCVLIKRLYRWYIFKAEGRAEDMVTSVKQDQTRLFINWAHQAEWSCCRPPVQSMDLNLSWVCHTLEVLCFAYELQREIVENMLFLHYHFSILDTMKMDQRS